MGRTDMNSWDAEGWIRDVNRNIRLFGHGAWRNGRLCVFNNTVRCVEEGGYLSQSGLRVSLNNDFSTPGGMVHAPVSLPSLPSFPNTSVEVWNEDTFLAAKRLQDEGLHVAALNMANRFTPGGGVINGAGAQEENLFRRSNLYRALFAFHPDLATAFSIPQADRRLGHYPMHRDHGGIFAKDITVFRGTEGEGYPLLDNPYSVNVVSVAAINRPELDAMGRLTPPMVEGTKNKVRTILRLSIANGCDAVVLGAFGCGAFCNPPAQVAQIFGEVFREKEFAHSFRKIVFAILDDHNAGRRHNPEGNFKPFAYHFRNFVL